MPMEPTYTPVIGALLTAIRVQNWKVRVSGVEHLPATGGAVIATNHVGYLDFVWSGYGVSRKGPNKRKVRYAAKRETFDHWLTGPIMRGCRHIPVDRGGAASDAIDHAVELLEAGELVGMFPESTISRSFVPLPGKTGTVRMAQRAGVPIIPGAVWGSQILFTKGRPKQLSKRSVLITVDYGEPMEVGPDEDPQEATDRLMRRIGEMVDQAQRTYPVRPAPDEDPWWIPAHLGGTAPTPEEAERMAKEEAAARKARRSAEGA